MKALTKEIKLTIELMQGDIDDGAHGELQTHLYSLLEMKRELLGKRVHTNMSAKIQVQPADAWELGYKELGGLMSNCPYSSAKGGGREAQLANAWVKGYEQVNREAGKIPSASRSTS